ncbi:MAG: DNA-processing protein DprA [Candidatus Dojkabacteria bacterium]|jgi:DNA processing protein|nr:DNA-processing protein DprA [Candidatus Dojkabacteria bacterium]MDD2270116.1 DNA-processing protein DprA [Candidatus Dojkabacteria bacterium]
MEFNKYRVALDLSQEGVGRKAIIEKILNGSMFSYNDEVREYSEQLKKESIYILSSNEKEYPASLKEISDYPLLLFCKGKRELLSKKMITVVGTRNMSSYGKWSVKYILKVLKGTDVAVVSGLANGIDCEVHRICLEFGIPTIAVVAGGIDKGYPRSNQYVYDEISKRGLVLSEFPKGRKITKGMFPMRNRILAGISSATVVIESDIRGGSLITADLALEYGREIFCLPCNINKYSSQGCNMYISKGATPLYDPIQLLKFYNNELYT